MYNGKDLLDSKMKEKIRIGLYLDNEIIPLWLYRVIEKIYCSEYSEITTLIINNSTLLRDVKVKHSLIYKLHEKLDYIFFRNKFDYNQTITLNRLLDNIPRVKFNFSYDVIKQEMVINGIKDELSKFELDIIFNFSSVLLKDPILRSAKFGIWSYNLGDYRTIRGFSNGYWEIVQKIPEIGINVKILDDSSSKETIIYSSCIANYSNSLNLNRDYLYGLASLIIPRLLKGLYQNGTGFLDKLREKHNVDIELLGSRIYRPPSSIKALSNLIVIIFRSLYQKINIKRWNWFLLYSLDSNTNPIPTNLSSYKTLMPPKDRFWADPFVVSRNNKHYIFVEELIYKENKGHISVLELDYKGDLIHTEKIIEKPYHMSYPFVFEWAENYYMIPDTSKNNTIELYKSTNFPLKWDFVMNLMENAPAKDTTLFFYRDKWWLFTAVNDSPNNPNFDELFLFYSTDLLSNKWISHPENPIISDVRIARPAGRIFMINNKIYRPSQDCSGRYGRAFNINEIHTLTETSYEEKLILKVEANWKDNLKGTHTYNFDQKFTVIDAYIFEKYFF